MISEQRETAPRGSLARTPHPDTGLTDPRAVSSEVLKCPMQPPQSIREEFKGKDKQPHSKEVPRAPQLREPGSSWGTRVCIPAPP